MTAGEGLLDQRSGEFFELRSGDLQTRCFAFAEVDFERRFGSVRQLDLQVFRRMLDRAERAFRMVDPAPHS